MKSAFVVFGAAMCLVSTSALAGWQDDGTIKLTQGAYSYGNGGEFTAVTTGALGNSTFQTFCLEYNEEFGPGSIYHYQENSGAVAGDAGANSTDSHTGLPMDKLSIGTAWLYSQFRAGTLAGYNFGDVANFNAGNATLNHLSRNSDAGALQNAFWYLENEVGSLTAAGQQFYNEAVTAAAGLGMNVTDDSGGRFGVIALNLFNGPYSTQQTINGVTYNLNQDQLAIVPEPTTFVAGALLLLPFGLGALRSMRKLNKS